MARVRRDRPNGLLLGIEAIGVEANILAPESLFEAPLQVLRLPPQLAAVGRIVQDIEHLGHAQPGIVDIALQLAESLRLCDLSTVGIHDGVARVLPSHVLVALRRSSPVFLEPIAVDVSVPVDPLETPEGNVAAGAKQTLIARPPPGLVKSD